MKRKCLGCGKEFEPAAGRQRYCTKRCCQISYRKRKVSSYRAVKKCKICGAKFVPLRPTKQTCSYECACIAEYRRRRARRQEKIQRGEKIVVVKLGKIKCLGCGKIVMAKSGTQKYCSDECRMSSYKKKRTMEMEKVCEVCGRRFKPNKNQKYCSDECRKASRKKKYKK